MFYILGIYYLWASLVARMVKNYPVMRQTWIRAQCDSRGQTEISIYWNGSTSFKTFLKSNICPETYCSSSDHSPLKTYSLKEVPHIEELQINFLVWYGSVAVILTLCFSDNYWYLMMSGICFNTTWVRECIDKTRWARSF